MGKFLEDMISLGIEGVFAYSSAKKKIEEAGNILSRLTSEKEEVPAEEFIKMYDMRSHNFNSKQDDIKFLKNFDFEGVYILHNCSRNVYLIGRSSKVFRKIDRQFRGYENQDIYRDWQRKHHFTVKIVKFENSGYSDINMLEQDLTKKYGNYPPNSEKKPGKASRFGFWGQLFK